MIHTEINFGLTLPGQKSELEDVAETYIASLFHGGQLCGEYFLTWKRGQLICDTLMAGLGASRARFHSRWALSCLKKFKKAFGRQPVWTLCDDDVPRKNVRWTAPTLHLFTHAFDWGPPLGRGDDGRAVPTFLLPVDFQIKQDIYSWQQEYVLHDRLWLSSGSLEVSAYRELVDPFSGLSTDGRELCAAIEKTTHVPTYYFLMRFYAPDLGQDDRPCPGCGKNWRILQPAEAPFHQWPFRCERCRLVSTTGTDVNRRLAKIGQWNADRRRKKPNRQ
jgi:predicted  nucleic acid-binding Zn ribbon protein